MSDTKDTRDEGLGGESFRKDSFYGEFREESLLDSREVPHGLGVREEPHMGAHMGESVPVSSGGRGGGKDAYEQLNSLAARAVRRSKWTSFFLTLLTLLWAGGLVFGGIYVVLFEDLLLREWLSYPTGVQVMFVIGALLPLTVLWLMGYYIRQAQGMFFQAESVRIQSSILTDPSNEALQRIHHVAKILLEQMTQLGHVNNNASKKLEGLTDTLKLRTDGLRTTGMDAQSMLTSSLTDMQTLSDRIEHLLNRISMQGDSFSELIKVAEGALKSGNDEMSGWQERFRHVTGTAEEASRDLSRMGESLKSQLIALEEASIGVTAQSERHLGSFRTETMGMLDEVGRATRKVVDEAKGLQEDLQSSADHLQVTAGSMKESNAEIVRASEEKSERLLLAAKEADRYLDEMEERLKLGFGSMEENIEKVTDRLEGVLKVLNKDDSPINNELKKFLTGIEQVTQRFTTQAANLVSASHVAAERSEAINVQLDEQRRDIFLKAARYLLQDMHSTSLDLTRALGDEITDQELKRFMNGDASIFTQNLIGRNLGKLEREIVEKLEVSKEARDYALRFMQQFERLLDDARQVDPERILQASFITSDIGKLYMVLCRSSGRRPNRQLTSVAGGGGT
jgi:methyl-accepting chemotaxis protein